MSRGYQWLLSILLICTAGVLGSKLVSKELSSVEPATTGSGVAETDKRPDLQELTSVTDTESYPIDMFTEVIARPLFFRNRRPEPSPSDAEDGLSPIPSSAMLNGSAETARFMVMGIVIDNQVKIALLKSSVGEGDVIRVKEGEKLQGWTVSAIATGSVTFRQGDSENVIKLSDNVLSGAEKRRLMQQAKLAKARSAARQPKRVQRNKTTQRKTTIRPTRTTTRRKIPTKRVTQQTPKTRQPVRD